MSARAGVVAAAVASLIGATGLSAHEAGSKDESASDVLRMPALMRNAWAALESRHGRNQAREREHRAAHGDADRLPVESMVARSDPRAGINPAISGRAPVQRIQDFLPFVRPIAEWVERIRGRPILGIVAVGRKGPPDEVGLWGAKIEVPVIPIFVALLPDGRVLMWDTDGSLVPNADGTQSSTRAAIWNPVTGQSARNDIYGANLFCAGFVHVHDGRLFIAGGQARVSNDGLVATHVFDPSNDRWFRGPNMSRARWYPSIAALGNGEHYIIGGGPDDHEVRRIDNTIQRLNGFLPASFLYPFAQTAPNGRVAYLGPEPTVRYIDTAGSGSVTAQGQRDALFREYGSYAMYDVGKVIVTGGGTRSATLLELGADSIAVTPAADMSYSRKHHNLTLLPDGTVLATGGYSTNEPQIDLENGVFAAERWNPATGHWTELAGAQFTRQYHSTALLLPDGRVMTGGTGACQKCLELGYNRADIEIFSPPYLFKKGGAGELAPRPVIIAAPATADYGAQIDLSTPQAASVARVSLIRLGAPTHAIDQGQRFVPLGFEPGPDRVRAMVPANPNVAPPGFYMLFIVDAAGVPSVARMIRIGGTPAPLAGLVPTSTTPPAPVQTPAPPPSEPGVNAPAPTPANGDGGGSGGGSGGCTLGASADSSLVLLVAAAAAWRRRRRA